jgi:hypothetical protein
MYIFQKIIILYIGISLRNQKSGTWIWKTNGIIQQKFSKNQKIWWRYSNGRIDENLIKNQVRERICTKIIERPYNIKNLKYIINK